LVVIYVPPAKRLEAFLRLSGLVDFFLTGKKYFSNRKKLDGFHPLCRHVSRIVLPVERFCCEFVLRAEQIIPIFVLYIKQYELWIH